MLLAKYTTNEEAEQARTLLDVTLGYSDGHGTDKATGPARLGTDGIYYLIIREKWLDILSNPETVGFADFPAPPMEEVEGI